MELQGKIKVLNETKTFGDKGFRKRELVITTEEQYPQSILIEFVQDKTDLLNAYKVGDNVKVGINIGGREWVNPQGETKYFNSITGWRIEKVGDNPGSAKPFEPAPFESDNDLNEEDTLPF
jgi:hypothetical protein